MKEKKEITSEQMRSNKYVFMLSLPIFVEQLLQLLVGNIDQIMISQYSHKSVAAVVNGNQIMSIIIIVLNMMSMAAAVVIPPQLSLGKRERVNRISTMSVTLIATLGLLASIITVFFHNPIFALMKVEKDVLPEASIYLSIVGGFAIVQGLYLALAAILRSHTLTKEVMFISIIMNILNIIGNALLINGWLFFPQLGVMGAAISTAVSKTIGLILIYIQLKKKTDVKLRLYFLKHNPLPTTKQLLSIGFPAGVEALSYNLSQMFILGLINTLGNIDVVTKGYCSILANFCYIYAVSIAQAAQISVGYLLGAKELKALSKRVWNTLFTAFCCCVGFASLMFFNSDLLLSMFNATPEIKTLGHMILFIEIFLEIGRSSNIVMTRMLIAVGDAKTPLIFGLSGHWIIAALFSYLLGIHFELGLCGMWIAMALDECARGFTYVIVFKRGKWKKHYLISQQ